MFGSNLPAKGLLLILGAILIFFTVGCAVQEPVEEEPPAETPVEDDEEEAPDESAEHLLDQVYISKEEPLSPHISGFSIRTGVPLVSPDQNHLLGAFRDQLMLYEYPEKTLLKSYDFDQAYSLQYYTWHPRGDVFVVFVESDHQLHIYLVDLDGGQKKIKTFDQAAYNTNVISLEGLDARVGFLEWAFRGEALALDIHREEYSSVKLISLDGQILQSKDWDDRSFLRSPLADPEGRQIAFTRFGLREENLWIWELNDEEIRRVTDGSEGDYPFYWLDQSKLKVVLGAIGPGGGHHYGLAQVNLETGEREWEYSVVQDGMMYVVSGLSPDISLVLGTERGMAGTGSRASILDLETREKHYFLEDYSIYQSEWISVDVVVFNAGGWKREEDRYSGIEDRHVIKLYSLETGLTTLAEDDERLYLLGVANGEVHYLETADDGSLWVWQTKELESE